MTRYLLDIAYLLVLLIASPWLAYVALRTGKYRQGYAQKLLGRIPRRSSDSPCIWLHAVSMGEVNVLVPFVKKLRDAFSGWDIVISTTTTTGFELARSKFPDAAVHYCPLDFSWAVRAALRRIRPRLLVLTELELWPNLIAEAASHGAVIAVVNGRLSEKSFHGYWITRWFWHRALRRLSLVAAQNDTYAKRFKDIGINASRVFVTGSIKYDGANLDRKSPSIRKLSELAGISADDVVFLAGSTGEPEEELALRAFQQLHARYPRLRLILVPRHPERFGTVASLLKQSGMKWARRSGLENNSVGDDTRILLVDKVGELGTWWGAAHIAFVGGSLNGRGGQNMIEPAAYGAAVCFGPNTWNFHDVVTDLLAAGGAYVVRDQQELISFALRCLEEPQFGKSLGRNAQQHVLGQQGATDRTIELLRKAVMPVPQVNSRSDLAA